MRRLLLVIIFQLSFFLPLFPQTNAADTIRRDSTRETVERVVRDYQDSINRERLLRNIEKHGQSLDEFLAERREMERKEARRRWTRIGAGALFLFVLIFTAARRYRNRKKS